MQLKHKQDNFTIKVTSKHGKPVVTKKGFVNIEKGQYRHCNCIAYEILKNEFEKEIA